MSSSTVNSSEITFGSVSPPTISGDENGTYMVTSDGTPTGTPTEMWKFDSDTGQWVKSPSGAICPGPMTRAELLSLRAASGLKKECHYVITDYNRANVGAATILLHAVDANTLSMEAEVKTSYDNIARHGLYDIDNNYLIELEDSNNNQVNGREAVDRFPRGQGVANNVTIDSGGLAYHTGGNMVDIDISGGAVLRLNGGTIRRIELGSGGTLTMNNGTLSNTEVSTSGQLTINDGAHSQFTVTETAIVTMNRNSNYRNTFSSGYRFTQEGNGYVRGCDFSTAGSWTNGNVNLLEVTSHSSDVNTSGSSGYIYYTQMDRVNATGLRNVANLQINDASFSEGASLRLTGSALVSLVRTSVANGSRLIGVAGSRLRLYYADVASYAYVQNTTTGYIYADYCTIDSLGHIINQTPNTHYFQRYRIGSQARVAFYDDANNCRMYYGESQAGSTSTFRRGSINNYFFYNIINSAAQVQVRNTTNGRWSYNNVGAYSYLRAYGTNTGAPYVYYNNIQARGYLDIFNCTTRATVYGNSIEGQAILRVTTNTANGGIYYSNIGAYYYLYATLTNGSRTGLFGKGRRTHSVTNPTAVAPYATGSAWQNFN